MNNFTKLAIINLFLNFSLTVSFSQEQSPIIKNIYDKFNKYCKDNPWEEIYVHTDRDDYIAGEYLWFNIFLIDRQSDKLSDNSKIAYFELFNPDGRPVLQKRIMLVKGLGPGQVVLPDTLSSGSYILRVYTNRMKNFLPYNCFNKGIDIYNATSDRSMGWISKTTDTINENPLTSLSSANSLNNFVLKIDNLNSDTLHLVIEADETYLSLNNNLCYLFIQSHGVCNLYRSVKLPSEKTKLDIPKGNLSPGINHISFFDSKGIPIIERNIYKSLKEIKYLKFNIADNYKQRDEVSFDIDLDKSLTSTLKTTDFSIAVASYPDKKYTSDLANYMVFGTEFGELPQAIKNNNLNELSPDFINNFLSSVRSNWIDWNKILSGNLPVYKYNAEKEDHYLSGKLFNSDSSGNIGNKYIFLSTPGKNAVFQYAETDSNGNFCFNIPLKEEAQDIIIQPEEVSDHSSLRMRSSFDEEHSNTKYLLYESNKIIPKYISKWSANYQVNRIYEVSASIDTQIQISAFSKPKRFYGKPDIELFMDDYIQLPSMKEVFFELAPGTLLEERKSIYKISIKDPADNKFYEKPPILLIDGVIIYDPGIIANIDPEIVEKIDIVKHLYRVGDYIFFGLINIITRKSDFSIIEIPNYAIRLRYKAIEPVLSFSSPDYSTTVNKQNRIPDFRNTLYWNQRIYPDENGKIGIKFFASDIKGRYIINIQGVSPEGLLISGTKVILIE